VLLVALALGLLVAVAVVTLSSLVTHSRPSAISGLPTASHQTRVLFRDGFSGPDGVITNHYAAFSRDPAALRSPDWEVESGSLLRRHGAAWTGIPNGVVPNLDSSNGSGSDIFRLWTTRSDFRDVRVDMRLRTVRFTNGTARWPKKSWDGVKIWLRRQGASGATVGLYTAEVNRRQGNIIIQKKCPGSRHYRLLAQSPANHRAELGRWEHVGGSVRNQPDGSVVLAVIRDGAVALGVKDTGAGCRPITAPGKVGVRGDNTDFLFDDFTVTRVGGS
jgi:hypothetical protein